MKAALARLLAAAAAAAAAAALCAAVALAHVLDPQLHTLSDR
jgi:hypothetical protein